MDIVQTFYDRLAKDYEKLFADFNSESENQGKILDKIFNNCGFDKSAKVLDCASGIGTQSLGLAKLGYKITASDISEEALNQARIKAKEADVNISFNKADFRALEGVFDYKFDIIIAMDNALPHMLTKADFTRALKSIYNVTEKDGILVASIRDYDKILKEKPSYSPPYIHKTEDGQRVCFQTWEWDENRYKLIQYIIDDDNGLEVKKYKCEYYAIKRAEFTKILKSIGYKEIKWLKPNESNFYQPIVVAKK